VVTAFEVADNMDLTMVYNEFEAYYEMRFDKKPKMVRKAAEDTSVKMPRPPRSDSGKKGKGGAGAGAGSGSGGASSGAGGKLPTISNAGSAFSGSGSGDEGAAGGLGIQGSSVSKDGAQKDSADEIDRLEHRVLKPPPHLGADPDMKVLAALISREIYVDSPNVKFSDIIRLDEAKRLLSEAVMLPLRFPFIFTGLLR
jgi:katanin p60 ATPase-containing subunit A1